MQEDLHNKRLGQEGEDLAASYLKNRGYRILERNYRCRLGEIDMIAEKDADIHFVEVKTRRSVEAVSPLELISASKKRHISRVAQHYVAAKRLEDRACGFDVLTIDYAGGAPAFEFIEGAFLLAWGY